MKIGKIYKLYNTIDERFYIGSTVQKYISNRLATHRRDAKLDKRPKNILHLAMKEIGVKNWFVQELARYPVNNKRELCREEDKYIDWSSKHCLNQKKASGIYRDEYKTSSEYQQALYKNSLTYEKKRSKIRWLKIKEDPIKHEEYKKKRRERDRKRRAHNLSVTGIGQQ